VLAEAPMSRQAQTARRVRETAAAVAFGRELRASGTVTGVAAGQRAKWRLLLQQRVGAKWVTRRSLRLSRALSDGAYVIRWSRPAKASHQASAASAAAATRVRVVAVSPRGAAATSGTVLAAAPAASSPAAESCSGSRLIAVRGSGEKEGDQYRGYGKTMHSVATWLRAFEPTATSTHVSYEAIQVLLDPTYVNHRYERSVQSGIPPLLAKASAFMRACPGKRLYLAGFSQGAQVVGDAYLDWLTGQERARVTKVVLLGDPKFVGSQGYPVNDGDYNPEFNGVVTLSLGHSKHRFAASENLKVRSYRANGDPVCNFSSPGQLAGCALTSGSCPHQNYPGITVPGSTFSYTQFAAQFLAAGPKREQGSGSAGHQPGTDEIPKTPVIPGQPLHRVDVHD
jgi:hypothetical protein